MKMTIKKLRKLIKEEIARTSADWSAVMDTLKHIAEEIDGWEDIPGYELATGIGFSPELDKNYLEALYNDVPNFSQNFAPEIAAEAEIQVEDLISGVKSNLEAALSIKANKDIYKEGDIMTHLADGVRGVEHKTYGQTLKSEEDRERLVAALSEVEVPDEVVIALAKAAVASSDEYVATEMISQIEVPAALKILTQFKDAEISEEAREALAEL